MPGFLEEQHFDGHSAVHQAHSFLRGRLALSRYLTDTVRIGGRYYFVFPPFPAVVLLPLVAAFGTSAKTLLVTPLLAGISGYAGQRTLAQLDVGPPAATWCCTGLRFGTAWAAVAGHGTDTYFAHCVATTCQMVALAEVTGRRRGCAIGILLGCAFLSRQLTILLSPFFVLAAVAPRGLVEARPSLVRGQALVTKLLSIVSPLAVCMGVYGLLNWLRTGNPTDSSYDSLVEHGWYQYRANKFGQFHPSYLPSNLIRLLIIGPGVEFQGQSYMVPKLTGFGSSMTFSSPFLFVAFVRMRLGWSWLWVSAWACIGAILAAILLHKSALGGYQVHGLRYTLDLTPLLFVLASLKINRLWSESTGFMARWLIGYSIVAAGVALHLLPALRALLLKLPH